MGFLMRTTHEFPGGIPGRRCAENDLHAGRHLSPGPAKDLAHFLRVLPAIVARSLCGGLLLLSVEGCSGLRLPEAPRDSAFSIRTFATNTMRNNEVPAIPGPPLVLDWEEDLTAGFGEGAPLLVDSVLFLGNLRGELYALNAGTGKRFGWVTLGGAIHGAPVLVGNTAIVPLAGSRESLVAYDFLEGRILWRQELGDIHVSPLLLGSRVFVANTIGVVHCVSLDDGAPVWKFELPENKALKGIRSSPAGFGRSVFFGADDGFLYHLNAATGSQEWRFDAGASIQATPVLHEGRVYIGTLAGKLFAIADSTGRPEWSCDVGGSIYGTALVDSALVIVGTTAGDVIGLQRLTGKIMWKTELRAPVNSGILGAGEFVYAGTLRKDLVAIRRTTGEIVWRGTTGGRVKTTPTAGLGRLFVAGDNRVVQAFKEEKR